MDSQLIVAISRQRSKCVVRPLYLTALLLITLLCVTPTLSAQTLYVGCYRSIDNAQVEADSIRVVCTDRGIDTVVRGSSFTFPATTGVDDDMVLHGRREIDVFDLNGRHLYWATNSHLRHGLYWDEQFGLVIGRTRVSGLAQELTSPLPLSSIDGTVVSHSEKHRGAVTQLVEVAVTVWRFGYVPTTVTKSVEQFDIEIPIVLELLPWWQRVKKVALTAKVPECVRISHASGGHGGTAWSERDTALAPGSFSVFAGGHIHVTKGIRLWKRLGDTLTYRFDTHENNPNAGGGTEYTGTIIVDSVSGAMRSCTIRSIDAGNIGVRIYTNEVVSIVDLLTFNTITPGRLSSELFESSANAVLQSIGLTDRESSDKESRELEVFNHTRTNQGIELSVVVDLFE